MGSDSEFEFESEPEIQTSNIKSQNANADSDFEFEDDDVPSAMNGVNSGNVGRADSEFEFEDEDNATRMQPNQQQQQQQQKKKNIKAELEDLLYDAEDLQKSRPAESLSKIEAVIALCEENNGFEDYLGKALLIGLRMCFQLKDASKLQFMVDKLFLLAHKNCINLTEFNNAVTNVLELAVNMSPEGADVTQLDLMTTRIFQKLLHLYEVNVSVGQIRTRVSLSLRFISHLLRLKEFDAAQRCIETTKQLCSIWLKSDNLSAKPMHMKLLFLEFRMFQMTNNVAKVRELYPVILSPENMLSCDSSSISIVQVTGGRLLVAERRYIEAVAELTNAVRMLVESGDAYQAANAFSALMFAAMLSPQVESFVKPFEDTSSAGKVMLSIPSIKAVDQLFNAFKSCEMSQFRHYLSSICESSTIRDIVGEDGVTAFVDELMACMRCRCLLRKGSIQPFLTFHDAFVLLQFKNTHPGKEEEALMQLLACSWLHESNDLALNVDLVQRTILFSFSKKSTTQKAVFNRDAFLGLDKQTRSCVTHIENLTHQTNDLILLTSLANSVTVRKHSFDTGEYARRLMH